MRAQKSYTPNKIGCDYEQPNHYQKAKSLEARGGDTIPEAASGGGVGRRRRGR